MSGIDPSKCSNKNVAVCHHKLVLMQLADKSLEIRALNKLYRLAIHRNTKLQKSGAFKKVVNEEPTGKLALKEKNIHT